MKKQFSLSTVSIALIAALLLGAFLQSVISGDNIYQQVNKFAEILNNAEKNYVDEVDTEKLVESAINGMLESLDPHSTYIPAKQMQKVNEDFQGSFEGIGVEYDIINDTLLVVSPIPGGPSEALGIQAGDKIVQIDTFNAIGIKRDEVPKRLRGKKGTHVRVEIVRSGEEKRLEFDIIRDKIPLYTVDVSFMVNSEIGYLSVNRFAATTYQEFSDGMIKLKSQGMKKLVLDLRNNPGGYLDQAVKMVDEFLPGGKKIVYTKGRQNAFNEDYGSSGRGKYTDITVVIMVNQGSASASEIVSGAIQDWDRGLIVGETTFGKGLVQRQFPLGDGSAYRLTTARYYTPTGRLIQRPYGSDHDAYRKAAFEREEQEGENIDHKEENDSTKPKFKTPGGRTVFGGGGVTPDYFIKAERLEKYSAQLRGRSIFLEFVNKYLDRAGADLRSKYENQRSEFLEKFIVSPEMIDEVVSIATAKKIEFVKEEFDKDLSYIKAAVKAQIGRTLFGNEASYPVLLNEDSQFLKAISLFPEAEKLAHLGK
ncbi:MAG: S41 family peptidase [Bacteroidota bacterium]